jgi:hypothetical protein
MNRHQYILQMFARYGFNCCPLSNLAIKVCIRRGMSNSQIYSVGCDMFAGFTFREAVEACEQ